MAQKISGAVTLTVWQDMISRYEKYNYNKGKSPSIIYLTSGGNDYITSAQYAVMYGNYVRYINTFGTKPATIEITLTPKTFTPKEVPAVFGLGYFVDPANTPNPDYVAMKKSGITEVYYRVFNTDYTKHDATLTKIKAAGLKPYIWVWQGFLYTKYMADRGWNVCMDMEKYDMPNYYNEIKQVRADSKGKTFILCTKAEGWDGNQYWNVIKDYCDYLMPMLYLGDYNKSVQQLEAYMKLYNTKYPGKIYPVLETYKSDAEIVKKELSVLQSEIAACKPYCKGIGLFRYGLSSL